jgi:undecaprenyl-diphosphatase
MQKLKQFLTKYKLFIIFICSLLAFLLFTLLITLIDVRAIGPSDPNTGIPSSVGFATLNGWFHSLTGENMLLYSITDWGSLITFPIGATFLVVGIVELIKRKSLLKVDANILALGCFYILTFISYIVFEYLVVNYRPCLMEIQGVYYLEASYPSSTTLLAITLLISAIDQVIIYIKNKNLKITLVVICSVLAAFFVIGRAISGVHWLTDIIGGVLLSITLISFYLTIKEIFLKTLNSKKD